MLITIIVLAIIFAICYSSEPEIRYCFLKTSVIWGVILTLITEVLSYFHILNFTAISSSWLIFIILLLVKYSRTVFSTNLTKLWYQLSTIPPFAKILVSGVSLIIFTIGITCIASPPNNWDSMDYHMSRIMYWIQHQTVAHYPTSYTPQIYQNPWSEYVILHFQFLSGGDYFANCMQWWSLIGCVLGSSLIAEKLGADLRGQIFTAVVTATIPMGILQASSTQNDYALGFWLISLAYYTISVIQAGKNAKLSEYFLLGSSLGLAILTKGTAYVYVLPFLVWLSISQILRLRWSVWKPAAIVAFLGLSLNINHYLRNYQVFASPLGEPSSYKNEILGIQVLLSNILRNSGLHLGTPIGFLSGATNKIIQILHSFIGIDVSDPRTTFTKTFFVPGGWSTLGFPGNENSAGNLWHFLLFVALFSLYIWGRKKYHERYLTAYLITSASTFLIFCFLVKWQPWHSRLHLPFFILVAPFLGIILSRITQKRIVNLIVIFLLISSLPWLAFNRYKPLIGHQNVWQTARIEQYFSNRPNMQKTYQESVKFLQEKNCSKIGLMMGNDAWEYPLWMLLSEAGMKDLQLQHINVNNNSGLKTHIAQNNTFNPCAVFYMETKRSKQAQVEEVSFQGNKFTRSWVGEQIAIFLKK
ncbi:glycosyltransferase family 39 protein [Calothrix sp. 336/3]|uniref:glycosyltransferase family 39 protein n=1 Tax=Calothrix sp. 336/3 TaxID=1337936 RepID=UPI0004E2DDCA|nr:glycosyltransferase family 39 protein [Calothrix sp. 336/3]AKG20183.1 hypothetical protein IJ00_01655 [Calothrix sp. 336/3]